MPVVAEVLQLCQQYEPTFRVAYGTAGFRNHHAQLDAIAVRCGLLMALRARTSPMGRACGVMVTASHNPVDDNGFKLIDASGEMLHAAWEEYATQMANSNSDEVAAIVADIATREKVDWDHPSARVLMGRDTRPSSPRLAQLVAQGCAALGVEVIDHGLVTTPQLHWLVRESSIDMQVDTSMYFSAIEQSWQSWVEDMPALDQVLHLDCANGVGGKAAQRLQSIMWPHVNLRLNHRPIDDGDDGDPKRVHCGLNHMCGSDYVGRYSEIPIGLECHVGQKMASIDGDADRLVYYYIDDSSDLKIVDGDKIMALFIDTLLDDITASGLDLTLGAVQTAYANGAATEYLQNRGVEVQCTQTGVKHLHPKAKRYDIGVYFEANGHGTVLFADEALRRIHNKLALMSDGLVYSAIEQRACRRLWAMSQILSQCIGDGLADMMMVEAILLRKKWTIQDWDQHMYTDRASAQLTVRVKDKSVLQTADADRVCIAPEGLQDAIDQVVGWTDPCRRAFVRASGTENCVRVYAESRTPAGAQLLARKVAQLVETFC